MAIRMTRIGLTTADVLTRYNDDWLPGCNVVFNINFIADPEDNHFWTADDNPNFLSEGQNGVYVNPPGNIIDTWTTPKYSMGQWDRHLDNFIIAHEMTRFLWLPDTYDKSTHQPLPGFEHALTSDQGGNNIEIPQSQINDLVNGLWPDRNRPRHCDFRK